MRITIITGTHRKEGESLRIGRYIEKHLKANYKDLHPTVISLAENPYPLWDEGVWEKTAAWQKIWGPTAKTLQASDAFVVVTPEWSGMVPAGLKNFFLLCSTKEVGHKPALIVSVSSGMGGAYPVQELRMSSYKNTRICYLPEHMIIRDVEKYFKGDTPSSDVDTILRKRLDYCLQLLQEYAGAFTKIRESGVINYQEFPNGL